MVVLTGVVSIRVPNFAMFLDFSGAFSMTFLAFIMPVILLSLFTCLRYLCINEVSQKKLISLYEYLFGY